MDYNRYKRARDLSWQVLIDSGITELPVKVTDICRQQGISVFSYQKGLKILEPLGLTGRCEVNDGFAVVFRHNRLIFFNETCSQARCRFTIGHELGHFIAGHIGSNSNELHVTTVNREPAPGDDPRETEANIIASRILAPACVLWGLNIHSASDISRICDISLQSARFREERMKRLYRREQEFLQTKGKSCFCLSDLEKRVYQQFYPFIETTRTEL